ncbi:MAG: hypothetical protein O2904_00270 [bacterium]|nr:hypothetical protein [bacterium]
MDRTIPPIYSLLDAAHGNQVNILQGGGTLGRFDTVLPLLATICHRWPGSRNEDLQNTLIANAAGVPWGVSEKCAVTNEIHEDESAQLQRWFRVAAGLRKMYGAAAFAGVTDGSAIGEAHKSAPYADGLSHFNELLQDGRKHPDSLTSVNGGWVM